MGTDLAQQVPVNVAGSSTFGVYPKISLEKTYNMFITDGWLCNYAGFQKVIELVAGNEGRGLFHSIRGNFMVAVVGSNVFKIDDSLAVTRVTGSLDSVTGEVSMDENLAGQICIVDGTFAYIYDYLEASPVITKLALTNSLGHVITPSYVSYHNTYFLIAGGNSREEPQLWYVYEKNTPTSLTRVAEFPIQTKPDKALAVKRVPGRGNNVIVLGSAVGEIWTQVPNTQVYQRVSSYNMDSGCVSVSTIAASEEFVAWLGQNENNAPTIMISTGSDTKRISTDGIDHLLESIQRPDKSTAIFYRQNGHLFYQLTFYAPEDNLTLVYDFNTESFYHACDEDMNFYPARQIVFFNKATYFVSLNDAAIYQMGDQFDTYNYTLDPDDEDAQGEEIPRIRICKTIRKDDSSIFRAGMFTFWIEQGVNNYYLIDGAISNRPRVDMSISKNGNQSFGNIVSRELNPKGHYRNQIRWWRIGQGNELTIQLRFWGFNRFVVLSGICEIY